MGGWWWTREPVRPSEVWERVRVISPPSAWVAMLPRSSLRTRASSSRAAHVGAVRERAQRRASATPMPEEAILKGRSAVQESAGWCGGGEVDGARGGIARPLKAPRTRVRLVEFCASLLGGVIGLPHDLAGHGQGEHCTDI